MDRKSGSPQVGVAGRCAEVVPGGSCVGQRAGKRRWMEGNGIILEGSLVLAELWDDAVIPRGELDCNVFASEGLEDWARAMGGLLI